MPFNGTALKDAREAKGLTQEQLGVAAGLTGMTVHRLETGKTTWASEDTLHALADQLEVDADSLLTPNGLQESA